MRLLFLCHRIPYPPDKGDKIRAWHILDALADRHAVRLGCLYDDPDDARHVPALRARCAEVRAEPIRRSRLSSGALARLRPGMPLSLPYFHHPGLARWVDATLRAGVDAVFAFSSSMAQYAMDAGGVPRVLDMVDVDSEKFAAYAAASRWPMRAVWAREARTLLAFEAAAARRFDHTLFVSEDEARRFATLVPDVAARVRAVENGVDAARFDPNLDYPDPFDGETAIVFTGTMDYRPNIDAVTWFADAVLPRLRSRAAFWIVGAQPSAEVMALGARPGVRVTGRVSDTRPYLARAAVAVAPLRIARGIQNKVLEAMAMGRPVVATEEAFEGIRAVPGRDLLVARDADAMAASVDAVLAGEHPGMGAAARALVLAEYRWEATLAPLVAMFEAAR